MGWQNESEEEHGDGMQKSCYDIIFTGLYQKKKRRDFSNPISFLVSAQTEHRNLSGAANQIISEDRKLIITIFTSNKRAQHEVNPKSKVISYLNYDPRCQTLIIKIGIQF